jgi:DNA-binding response OmpR family regulator
MTATIKTAISLVARAQTDFDSHSMYFLNEDGVSMPVSGMPEELRKLSHYLPVIVLVPKSAILERVHKKSGASKCVSDVLDAGYIGLTADAPKPWFRDPNAKDTFEFGDVKGRFSTMEIHRKGRPVGLTCKEFKTLVYLIKNPRMVISRDELLNEVWGYENYPCTRTVDNHILRLRQKLETEPCRPRHFHTVRGAGYKFLP